MSTISGIPIRNVWYMLAYAFRIPELKNQADVKTENFKHIEDLFGIFLARGMKHLAKQGLKSGYIECSEASRVVRGRLIIPETIRFRSRACLEVQCEHDEFSQDILLNQILKKTAEFLLRKDLENLVRKDLVEAKRPFQRLSDPGDLKNIHWKALQYDRNSWRYRFLIQICRLVIENEIPTISSGVNRFAEAPQEHMLLAKIYEAFVANYLRKKFSGEYKVQPQASIDWASNIAVQKGAPLPRMSADVLIRSPDAALIIDTKYYASELATRQYGERSVSTLRSLHLYQIMSYVTNFAATHKEPVTGVLAYARSNKQFGLLDGNIYGKYNIQNHLVVAVAIDLAAQFDTICNQLDDLLKWVPAKA